jgi:hypothetical protein
MHISNDNQISGIYLNPQNVTKTKQKGKPFKRDIPRKESGHLFELMNAWLLRS